MLSFRLPTVAGFGSLLLPEDGIKGEFESGMPSRAALGRREDACSSLDVSTRKRYASRAAVGRREKDHDRSSLEDSIG